MRLTYVNRRFLDYYVPVLAALDRLVDHHLHVIYSSDEVPQRVQKKIVSALGDRAIGMTGEWKLGGLESEGSTMMANQLIAVRYQPGLYAKILATKPDVLIAEGFFKWSVAALACRLIRRIPLVVGYERTAHTERHAQWHRKLYRKLVFPLVDALNCNGSLSLEYAMSLGMPRTRITLGHMAADSAGLAEKIKKVAVSDIENLLKQWKTSGFVFLYVGQLIPRKGIRELLAGWRMFEAQFPGAASLVLVGDGTQRNELENYRREIGLRHVHFAGAVDYDGIAPYYAAADALIIPTLEDNWSLVVPEAMACGLPVLCSKYNGCWPELVQPGVNGWVFDPHAPEDIVKVLQSAVQSGTGLEAMGDKSREIESRYGPENAARSMFDACRIALERRGG